jgi:tyramine---L-glutamate ligase
LRVFVYEDLTGGGCLQPPCGSLLTEGAAMVSAVAADFAAIDQVEVAVFVDARIDRVRFPSSVQVTSVSTASWGAAFDREVQAAEWTVVIAPETDGRLASLCERVELCGGRRLGLPIETVKLSSDKLACSCFLEQRDLPTPRSMRFDAPAEELDCPIVVKPRFGAGSQDVRLFESAAAVSDTLKERVVEEAFVVEPFESGMPVSVTVFFGSEESVILPATKQNLSSDGRFDYLGGSTPLAPSLARRAHSLAERVIRALPARIGCLGIDMVLGATDAEDVVIELNPRITTSYVGLRKLIDNNLAECMLKVAAGCRVELGVKEIEVEFSAAGEVSTRRSRECDTP